MEESANIDVFLTSDDLPVPVEGEGDPMEDLGDQEPPSEHQNGENKEKDRSRRSSSRRDRRRSRSPRRSRSRSRDRDRSRKRFVTVNSTRIVVKNMPYELKWQDIKDIFRKEVGDVAYVEMIEGNDGKPRGIAVLEFKDKDAARKAIETMHQYKIHDRYLVVHEERDRDRRMFQSMTMSGGRDGGGGMEGRGGMGDMRGGMGPGVMGLGGGLGMGVGGGLGVGGGMLNVGAGGGVSPEVLAQLGIDGPICPQVFVANLDYKVTNNKLREVFRLAGNVTKAEIKEDKNGKSRGMGIVQFETALEAVQAISMFNNQSLYDRRMIVRMDKVPEDITPPNKLPSGLKSIGMGLGLGGSPLTHFGQANATSSGLGVGAGLGAGALGGGLGAGAGLGLGMDAGLGVGGLGGLGGLSGLGSAGLGAGLSGSSLGGLGKLGGLEGGHGMGLDSGMMGGGGGYGGASDRGRSRDDRGQRFTRPDNCTIQIKNLPYAVNWQDLRERFREIGEVKYAEIKMEKGRSTGQGLVRFSTEDDAVRAIKSMDRTRFEGRTIDVQMYRG